jgi:heme A synthase
MNLGIPAVPPLAIVAGGSTLFLLIVVQILIGLRKIHFKGPLHMRVHKTLAWVLLGFALVHAILGMRVLGIIS